MQENNINKGSAINSEGKTGSGNIVSEYMVEEKDTLPDIAKKYNLSVDEILAANKETLKEPGDIIKPGLKILIPFKEGNR